MKSIFTTSLWWVLIFFVTYAALSATGLIPLEFVEINARVSEMLSYERVDKENLSTKVSQKEMGSSFNLDVGETTLPDHIVIEKIGVDVPVVNPETRDISLLDRALLSGVVRFPGSGGLLDESNMFLFGHSTTIRNVRNTAFQAFNRLGELQIGDIISVYSGATEYRYKVISVSQVNKDKAFVEFSSGEKLLTLSTCDTFGERSDRFVVVARFLQSMPVQGGSR